MRRGRRRNLGSGFVAAVLAVFLASPALSFPDEAVQLIRGQGSDSTVDIMQDLDRMFNNTIGCTVIGPTTSATPKNHTCFDGAVPEDPPPPGSPIDNWDHDVALSFFALGSSAGIDMLAKQGQPNIARIEYARSSRAPRTSDIDGLQFVGYAKDAVPWVNFRGNDTTGIDDEAGTPAAGVDRLSLQNLKEIYLAPCAITNWNQIGGANAPIIVWTSQQSSGERATFDDKLTPGSSPSATQEACIPEDRRSGAADATKVRVIFENDASPIRECGRQTPGSTHLNRCAAGEDLRSIFHMGFGAWTAAPPHAEWGQAWGADLGRMCVTHPVAPAQCDGTEGTGAVSVTPTTIANGTYVMDRFVYNVYRGGPGQPGAGGGGLTNPVAAHAKDYMGEKGWICKVDGLHQTNPRTNINYGEEITARIAALGFVPIVVGAIGGGASGDSKCRLSNS